MKIALTIAIISVTISVFSAPQPDVQLKIKNRAEILFPDDYEEQLDEIKIQEKAYERLQKIERPVCMNAQIFNILKNLCAARNFNDYQAQFFDFSEEVYAFVALNEFRRPQLMSLNELEQIKDTASKKYPFEFGDQLVEVTRQVGAWAILHLNKDKLFEKDK